MFNPPHVGHLALARAAASGLGLRQVLLTPVLIPPHKPAKWDPGAEHRSRMCQLVIDDDPRLGVCTLELERPGPSYTVDTLRSIHASDPDAELTLIVGADMATTLASWREPREILELASLAVAEREDTSRRDVLDALAPLDGEARTDFVEMPRLDVSSSLVRRRLTAGEPIEDLVGAEVAAYIAEHELYGRQPAARAGRAAMNSEEMLSELCRYAEDKKAGDLVTLDVREVLGYTDWFVICSGGTERQAKAIHDGILEGLKHEHDLLPRRVEGLGGADWILMDYLDVVVHIFTPVTREFYRLEQLWGEVPARRAESI